MVRLSLAAVLLGALGVLPLAAQERTVILVRHAEKQAEPPNDPPLSIEGAARAAALAGLLRHAGVGSVIVTPTTRTRATGAPTAAASDAAVIEVPVRGGLTAHLAAVAAAVRSRPEGETVLVVGHSNTVAGIIAALGGPRLADLCDPEYARMFVLTLPVEGRVRTLEARYGPADPPDAASCRAESE